MTTLPQPGPDTPARADAYPVSRLASGRGRAAVGEREPHGAAAARLSTDHPAAREHAARLGEHLRWHGGMTLDYFHVHGQPQFIECNPRTVEPGNAARAGVNLPG